MAALDIRPTPGRPTLTVAVVGGHAYELTSAEFRDCLRLAELQLGAGPVELLLEVPGKMRLRLGCPRPEMEAVLRRMRAAWAEHRARRRRPGRGRRR